MFANNCSIDNIAPEQTFVNRKSAKNRTDYRNICLLFIGNYAMILIEIQVLQKFEADETSERSTRFWQTERSVTSSVKF
jgi:hypothetical protein